MAIPKARPGEPKKKKTPWDKVKNSALFILLLVIVATAIIVAAIVMLSRLLSTGHVF